VITYKIPYKSDYNFDELRKEYSSIVRYAYSRFLDGMNEKDIRMMFKLNFNGLKLSNSWIQQCGIREAKQIFKRFKNNKVIFGGKFNYIQRLKGKITQEEYRRNRLLPLNIQGEMLQYGNRMFDLDIPNQKIIFKLNRKEHIEINLPKIRKNWKNKLLQLQNRSEFKEQSFQIKIDSDFIYISFEDKNKKIYLKNNRYLGIDLNPSNIGISIIENNNILYTKEYSFKNIINEILNSKISSDSKKSKHLQNKLNHELIQISKNIESLLKYWKVKYIFVEDLKFKQKDSGLGKTFNRITKNLWKRNKFIDNLSKRIAFFGGIIFSINPAYSSFIGNIQHEYSDPINASIEIARRGYEIIIQKNKKFYPDLNNVKDQWKEYLTEDIKSWKEFFLKIKNLGLKYRVSLDTSSRVFSLFHKKSKIVYFVY